MIFDKLLSLLLRKELYMISDYSNKFVGSKKWGLDNNYLFDSADLNGFNYGSHTFELSNSDKKIRIKT